MVKNIIESIVNVVFGIIIAAVSFFDTHEIGLGICGCVIILVGFYMLLSELVKKNKDQDEEQKK